MYNEYISTWILDMSGAVDFESDIEDIFTDILTFGLGEEKDIVLDEHKGLYTIHFLFTSLPMDSVKTHRDIDRRISWLKTHIIETKGPEFTGPSEYDISNKLESLSLNQLKRGRSSDETDNLSTKFNKLNAGF
jgi:hypothetical protein